jgi:hypothetical protein
MAFFVGPYPPSMPNDALAGHLGLFNNRDNPANTYFPPTVGVEFDTFRNPEWDPNVTDCHIGVNVNNIREIAAAGADTFVAHVSSSWLTSNPLIPCLPIKKNVFHR